jgi:divalent metal cation (Fe/Co/Zn/Cd) transporter
MDRDRLLRRAIALSALSIAISGTFGIVAVAAALASDQLSLLGFGFDAAMDSVASVVLLWRFRLETSQPVHADRAERLAEVGVNLVLILLGVYLGIRSAVALVSGGQPETTLVGTVISVASLVVLPILAVAKFRTARVLSSRSLRADGALTAIAALLALVALVGAMLTETLGIPWADAVGGLVASVVLLREGTGGIRGLAERSGTSISMG